MAMTAIYAKKFFPARMADGFIQGSGVLTGSTKVAGSPDAPVRRRVQVVSAGGNAHGHVFPLVALFSTWTWADEAGNWEVRNLDPTLKYHVIAYDHTGQYDPVIKMNLIPTVD